MMHDIDNLTSLDNEEKGGDIVVEGVFALPWREQKWWLPYLHFGGALNLDGKTNQLYTGLHWNLRLGDYLFIEAGGGGALHDGHLSNPGDVDIERNRLLGCRILFRQFGNIGVTLSEHITWLVGVSHISNADLCSENDGLTSFGIQFQYQF